MTGDLRSPRILQLSWGRLEIAGRGGSAPASPALTPAPAPLYASPTMTKAGGR